jgi:hypothetical protein
VGGSTGTGDNHLDASAGSSLAPLDHSFWGAVCGENLDFKTDAKFL